MSEESRTTIVQPECDKTEVWINDEGFITIRQIIPVLDQTETITIHKSFWPGLTQAVAVLLAEKLEG